ncbi:MAG TPA: glycosyltransferase [Chitinophagaceae bacterium]|nr:glycosyltransferase [Chitinophagaceae bacterium]
MDGKTPLVSVVMSVYNGSKWLEEAIESIINQTYTNWEFIIVDDGSDEPTKKILDTYKNNPKFRILANSQKKGLTKNLNTAIKQASGEYIARMDADDVSLPDRFQRQVDYLNQHRYVSVISGFITFINEEGDQPGSWAEDRKNVTWPQIKSTLPWQNCLAHPSVMIRAGVFRNYHYNEAQTHSQDWDLWLQLAADNQIIEKIPDVILLYRVHSKSITASSLKKSAFAKNHETYKNYLSLVAALHKPNWFNLKVRFAFLFNRLKLFLSGIKRKSIS